MTNGAIVSFNTKENFIKAIKIIKKYNIYGFNVFDFIIINKNQLFLRVKIRSTKNLSKEYIDSENFKNCFFYEEKNTILKKNINLNIKDFIKSMVFIKTTSKHIPEGELFYKGIKIKERKIENIKIFNLVDNYL